MGTGDPVRVLIADDSGVQGTPTFKMDGKKLEGYFFSPSQVAAVVPVG
jgi:protein-disulfide isomerase